MAGVNWIYNSRIIRDDDGTGANNPVDVPLRFNVVATFFFFSIIRFLFVVEISAPRFPPPTSPPCPPAYFS